MSGIKQFHHGDITVTLGLQPGGAVTILVRSGNGEHAPNVTIHTNHDNRVRLTALQPNRAGS